MIIFEVNNGVQGFNVLYGCNYIGYIAMFGNKYQYSMYTNRLSINFNTPELQTIIDKVNELNTVKPIVKIDVKRYAQAIINTSEDRESGTCTHCLVDTYYHQHKPDCIVQDAKSVLKEKQ